MALDFNRTLASMIERFGKSRRPFAITVAGDTFYVATDPKHVAEIYRNENTLSSERITRIIHAQSGMSFEAVDKLLKVNTSASHNKLHPRPLPPVGLMLESLRQHLAPSDLLDRLLDNSTIPLVRQAIDLKWQDFAAPQELEDGKRVLSLKLLCIEAMVRGVVESFYGPTLWELEPDFVHWYMLWERVNWKYLFGIPGFLSKDMLQAKEVMIDLFVKYFSLPRTKRPGASAWILETEDILTEGGLSTEDLGRAMMLQTWAVLGNLYKTAFWMVSYIVYDRRLLEAIREETVPAVSGDRVHHHYLNKECPRLDSLFAEVLRISVSMPLVRHITDDTVIGGSTFRKGNNVMISYRQLHLNKDAWGANADGFQADRFLKKTSLKSSLSYRPFGGGSGLCPGRQYARETTFCFIAMLLSRYDLAIVTEDASSSGGDKAHEVKKPRFPQPDYSKPVVGVTAPGEQEDITIRLTPRRVVG
ncbi:putative cytochrome P450 [Aspergillus tamarii]|uniref:Putative cytochrome P450 n=1 Tax=Aspergillus tamarii TaxID=41984 RepID=A0A5N6VB91_ASPTM|nr:putative cytochrome P450 [Aspergillus tamarii]